MMPAVGLIRSMARSVGGIAAMMEPKVGMKLRAKATMPHNSGKSTFM